MKFPELIELQSNCSIILSQSLKATEPYEGCALLLGTKNVRNQSTKKNTWQIKFIWPCCNHWDQSDFHQEEPFQEPGFIISTLNRFAIDPQEQFAAQRWGRTNNWSILGTAHSHPTGENTPSIIDLEWKIEPGLMIISNQNGLLKAWWIESKHKFQQLQIAISS